MHLALNHAARGEPLDWFCLVNRLVVESHLIVLLGVDIPAGGLKLPTPTGERFAADILDDSLAHQTGAVLPTYTAQCAAPVVNWLMDRLALPREQLGGIEAILAAAQAEGKISSMEVDMPVWVSNPTKSRFSFLPTHAVRSGPISDSGCTTFSCF